MIQPDGRFFVFVAMPELRQPEPGLVPTGSEILRPVDDCALWYHTGSTFEQL